MSAVHEAPALDPSTSDIGRPWEREMAVRVMTGYVAHELNHPLGTIINLANILSRRLADPVVRSKDLREHVKNIKAEAVRATSIIKNMRMLTEHKPVAHESLSLLEVCHDAIARMKPLARSKHVKIRFEARAALIRVQGVKELLETALCNFVSNSIAALDLANVTSRLVTIRILAPNPAESTIQVLDNGIGIPGSIRDKVFEPFVTTRPDGTGLGLAIAGDIIRLHHGRVSCRRRRTGTCMEMILPQDDASAASVAAVMPVHPQHL
jgi:signal transduction histidine kinase